MHFSMAKCLGRNLVYRLSFGPKSEHCTTKNVRFFALLISAQVKINVKRVSPKRRVIGGVDCFGLYQLFYAIYDHNIVVGVSLGVKQVRYTILGRFDAYNLWFEWKHLENSFSKGKEFWLKKWIFSKNDDFINSTRKWWEVMIGG